MRAINKVIVSGEITDRIRFGQTPDGVPACSFWITIDRSHIGPSAQAKVNVYGDRFVDICHGRVYKGGQVLVDGELMNRQAKDGELLTEVRALELFFQP